MSISGFQRHLAWGDFKTVGQSLDGGHDAMTSAVFRGQFAFSRTAAGTFKVSRTSSQVAIRLNGQQSWVVRGRGTAALLAHEQGHYNLTALGGRDLWNGVLALEADSARELQSQIADLQASTQAAVDAVNVAYDEDVVCGTQHGSDAPQQAQWNLRMNAAMNSPTGSLADLAACPASTP